MARQLQRGDRPGRRPRGVRAGRRHSPDLISADEFWATSSRRRPVPTRLEDLVIYELHVGSLGFAGPAPGTLADAMRLLDYLDRPRRQRRRAAADGRVLRRPWAGATATPTTSCIESSAGGRDKYKHFVRECHRRGIAVIQDVVYNHYDQERRAGPVAVRLDRARAEHLLLVRGEPSSDYAYPDGGYLDNGSTGCAPRFWEETGPAAVHQQRRRSCRGVPRRRAAGGPDPGHPPRQRAARQRAGVAQRQRVRAEAAARVEPDAADDPADGDADRRGPQRLGRGHEDAERRAGSGSTRPGSPSSTTT